MIRTVTVLAAAASLALAVALAQPGFAQSSYAPAGAQFEVRLDQELSSRTMHDGDRFTMTEHEGFFHHAPPALKNARLEGHVENVSPAGPGHRATMKVVLDDVVMADGTKAPIDATITSLREFDPRTHHLRDTGIVLGSAIAGHMLGKRHGMRHGGLIGAGAGLVLATHLKSDIDVKRGTIVHVKLLDPITTVG